MLEQYDGFTTLYAKLTLTVSGITLEVRSTGSGEDLVFETASTIF